MKLHKNLIRLLSILTLCALLSGAVFAEDQTVSGENFNLTASDTVVEIIKRYEGFIAYPQNGFIGHGSNTKDAEDLFGANYWPITEAQAEQLTRYQLGLIGDALNLFLKSNNIVVNQNQFDALVDFTYGVGIGWTTYQNTDDGSWCKLKAMLLEDSSQWTEERTRAAFGTWVYYNGQVLSGLVVRRAEEAELFLTPVDDAQTGIYKDTRTNAWYYDYIVQATEKGIMEGMGDGTFAPEQNLTRAQLVVALARYDGAVLTEAADTGFTDVAADAWYAKAVVWAAENGYVEGMGNGIFAPEQPITREQVCTVLSRYLQAKGYGYGNKTIAFTDMSQISSWAQEHVNYCVSIGLIDGMGDGTFAPAGYTLRCQIAKLLVCMSQLG